MQKINFQDLPDTTTPVNASNMNTLQTNVENAISRSALTRLLVNIPNERLNTTDNLDNFYNELGVKMYSIWENMPIGMPTGAYQYGILIVITQSTTSQFLNTQIYIPDSITGGMYVRSGTRNWRRFTGTEVEKTTS